MRPNHVPVTGPRYWIAMALASIFGVNMGDFVARIMHLGHWKGLPLLLALFVAVAVVERLTSRRTEVFYWAAVVIERTAATNIADWLTHDLDLDYGLILAGCAAVLVGAIALGGVVPPLASRQAVQALPAGVTLANPRYWFAMLLAETLGTALSDAFADWMELPFPIECGILVAMFAIVFGVRNRAAFVNRLTYWLAVLVVGTCGPTAGDWLAHSGHLRLATFVTGGVLVGLLMLWKPERALVSPQAPSVVG